MFRYSVAIVLAVGLFFGWAIYLRNDSRLIFVNDAFTLALGSTGLSVHRMPRIRFAEAIAASSGASKDAAQAPTGDASQWWRAWPSLLGQVAVEDVILTSPRIVLDLNAVQPGGELNAEQVLTPLIATLANITFRTLKIENGVVIFESQREGGHVLQNLNASFEMARTKSAASGSGTFSYRGEVFTFEASVGIAKSDGDKKIPLQLMLASAKALFEFDGHLTIARPSQLAGNLEIGIPDVRKLLSWLDLGSFEEGTGGDDLRAVKAAGKLVWGHGTLSLSDAELEMDGNIAEGVVTINFDRERPVVDASIAMKALDLSKYRIKGPSLAGDQTELPNLAGEFVRLASIDLDRLERIGVDWDVRLSVSQLTYGTFETGAGAATLSLRSKKLLADIAELSVLGGVMTGQIEVDASEDKPRISVQVELENVAAEQCFALLWNNSPIVGEISLSMKLEANGHTRNSLADTLGGELRLVSSDSGEIAADIVKLAAMAAEVPLEGWPESPGSTTYDQFTTEWNIENGRAYSTSMEVIMGEEKIVGKGVIDLAKHDFGLQFSLLKDPGESGALQPTSTLELQGPWSRPVITMKVLPVPNDSTNGQTTDGNAAQ